MLSPLVEVCIPSLTRELDESGKPRKLFRLEVLFNGRKHCVDRHHAEFLALHRRLKKILRTPEFPSKRNQNLRSKPVEQRRLELEEYMQVVVLENQDVPQDLLDFLQLKHFHSCSRIQGRVGGVTELGFRKPLYQQRVVGFAADPYRLQSRSGLPDVVVGGVLQGLYLGRATPPRIPRITISAPRVSSTRVA